MTAIPATIQVGPAIYTVEFLERLLVADDSKALLGLCASDRVTIKLDPRYKERLAETFLHEVLHAINHDYTLEMDHNLVDRLAPALLDTIRRNNLDFLTLGVEDGE